MTNNELDLNTTEQVDPSTDITTVGAVLRKAREAKGLTIQEVALQLHLRPSVVTDLENDKFDAMSSATYVRGYVKNYARIIDANRELIQACLQRQLAQDIAPTMQSFSRKTTKEARDKKLIISTYLILLVLFALLVLWWVQKSSPLNVVDVSQPSVEEVAATQDEPLGDDAYGRFEPELHSGDDEYAQGVVDIDNMDTASAPNDAALNVSASSEDATATNEAIDSAQDSLQGTSESSPAEVVNAIATDEPVLPAVAGLEQLYLSVSADCWVNVVDATGKVLIDGVKTAGYTKSVNGKAPIKIILGAPSVVTMTLNGQAVSLVEYLDGRVARFTLPQS